MRSILTLFLALIIFNNLSSQCCCEHEAYAIDIFNETVLGIDLTTGNQTFISNLQLNGLINNPGTNMCPDGITIRGAVIIDCKYYIVTNDSNIWELDLENGNLSFAPFSFSGCGNNFNNVDIEVHPVTKKLYLLKESSSDRQDILLFELDFNCDIDNICTPVGSVLDFDLINGGNLLISDLVFDNMGNAFLIGSTAPPLGTSVIYPYDISTGTITGPPIVPSIYLGPFIGKNFSSSCNLESDVIYGYAHPFDPSDGIAKTFYVSIDLSNGNVTLINVNPGSGCTALIDGTMLGFATCCNPNVSNSSCSTCVQSIIPNEGDCQAFANICYCEGNCDRPEYETSCKLKIPLKFYYNGNLSIDEGEIPSDADINTIVSDANLIFSTNNFPVELYVQSICAEETDIHQTYCSGGTNALPGAGNYDDFTNGTTDAVNVYVLTNLHDNSNCDSDILGAAASFPWWPDAGIRILFPPRTVPNSTPPPMTVTRSAFTGFVLAHEIGHILGLRESFDNEHQNCLGDAIGDGIGDTPLDCDGTTGSITNNIMDYNDFNNFDQTISPTNVIISECQKAKMLDVLYLCKNDYCDTEPANYFDNPDYFKRYMCLGGEVPTFEAKNECYTWYEKNEDGTRGDFIVAGASFTPQITPSEVGEISYILYDNGFEYNPNCTGITITLFIENCSELDITQVDGETTVVDENGDELMFFDPCFCGNPLNILNPDGTVLLFHNYLEFTAGSLPNTKVVVNSSNNFFDEDGNPITGCIGFTDANGEFYFEFYHPVGIPGEANITAGGTGDFVSDVCQQCIITNAIPTLGEWGIIILSLLLLIFGVTALKQTEIKEQYS